MSLMHRSLLRLLLATAAFVATAGVAQAQAPCAGDPASALTVRCVAADELAKIEKLPKPVPAEVCGMTRFVERLGVLTSDAAALAAGGTKLMLTEEFAPIDTLVPGSETKVRTIFHDETYEVQLVTADGDPGNIAPTVCFISSNLAKSLDATATSVSKAVRAYNQPLLQDGAVALRRLSDTWQWIITDGFGQFPWERALSDALDHSRVSPYNLPRTQLIFVHPSVGVEISGGKRLADLRNRTSLFVEPLGLLHYNFNVPNGTHSYWGVSALLVLNADQAPGFGGLVRMNKFAFGAVRHLKDTKTGETGKWSITATVELLERAQAVRGKLTDGANDAKKIAATAVGVGGR